MSKKNKVIFDELDQKCLNELPLILDVVSATSTKVIKLLSPYYFELTELIGSNLKPKWEIGKRSYETLCYPLTSEYSASPIKIRSLEASLKIESAIEVNKIEDKKMVNFFWAYFGFESSINEESAETYFYFTIGKEDVRERFGGNINSLAFYNNIISKNKKYHFELAHPDKGDDCIEIQLQLKQMNPEMFNEHYQVFISEMLLPFMNSLK